jgi:hypothetical protein
MSTQYIGDIQYVGDIEIIKQLEELSKRHKMPMKEIDELAKIIAMAPYDPLSPSEWGERFRFDERKWWVTPEDDFSHINRTVPPPNATVDLEIASLEYVADIKNAASIYDFGHPLSAETHCRLFLNHWHWHRFWAVRHSKRASRLRYRHWARRFARTAERAQAYLDALPLEPLDGEVVRTFLGLKEWGADQGKIAERRKDLRIVKKEGE